MADKIKLNVELKLIMGFLFFFIISGMVPGIVSVFISLFDIDIETANLMVLIITFSVSVILCVIIGLYLIKWIAEPIKKLITAMEKMLEGDMTVDPIVTTGDEIEAFSISLLRMKSSLMIATQMLGPYEVEEQEIPEVKGFSVGEKMIFSLILFLVLNPIITIIPVILSLDLLLGASIASLLFSVIMLLIFVTYLNRSIMEPFIALTEAADKISKGDFGTSIEIKSSGDIGRLELNFKRISDRVERAIKEMENGQ